MDDGRIYWLGPYKVRIVSIDDGWVRYRYLNPTATMKREDDGMVYGRIAVAAFAIQNRRAE